MDITAVTLHLPLEYNYIAHIFKCFECIYASLLGKNGVCL